jgi:hypothetical protein
LIDLFENYIVKHRKALTASDIKTAKEGFRRLEKGSALVFEVLEQQKEELLQLTE